MMESATPIKPEYLVGPPLEYETEFYLPHPEGGKWTNTDLTEIGINLRSLPDPAGSSSVSIDTEDHQVLDDLVALEGYSEVGPGSLEISRQHHLLPAQVFRPNKLTASTSLPVYIASKPIPASVTLMHHQRTQMAASHPPLVMVGQPRHYTTLTRIASLDNHSSSPDDIKPLSRLRTTLTSTSHSHPGPALSAPVQPVQCTRCGEELNSKCLVQACTKPNQTTCKSCGGEMSIKCILAVCNQDYG